MNMKILGITTNFLKANNRIEKNNQGDYSSYRLPVRHLRQLDTDVFQKQSDISFSGILGGGEFKNILNNRTIHCIYCGRPMLSNKVAAKLKNNGVFSGPIQNFAQEMLNYLQYLHPTEKETLKKITIMAFDAPNIRLSEAIKRLYPEANAELLKEQKPILKELAAFGDRLPYGYKTKYKKLMQVYKNRLEEKEYIPEEFSGKEFAYKLSRISETIKDENLANRILKLTEPLTHPIFKKSDEPLTDKFATRILALTETRDFKKSELTKPYLQKLLIKQINLYAEILNRKDIMKLCQTAIDTIDKKPVKIKFSNKALRYDLNEVLEGMPNETLYESIMNTARRLPTSQTSVNAFITKHENSASDAIGYDILRPSIVTIEHMHPKSQNGSNSLANYALSCGRDNNNRSSEPMNLFIEQFSQGNQQQYFDEIYQEVIKNRIPKDVFFKMLKTFTKESGRSIDTSKY